jgi:hypothetical protein
LRNAGLDHQQSANLAGVLHAESGGYTGSFINSSTEHPGALNTQGAYGLAQLNGPRQAQLLAFAGSPEAAADPQTQLNFIAKDATSGKYGNLDLYNVRSIVDKYETPRIDLRAGEAAVGRSNAARLSETSYDPTLNGLNPSSAGPSNANGITAGSADPGSTLGYSSPGFSPVGQQPQVETSAGSVITGFRPAGETAEVDLGFPGDGPVGSTGSSFDPSSFSSSNVAGGAQAGSFGLGGVTSGGTAVGGTGSNLSLDGATLDKGVTAQSVTGGAGGAGGDPIVGYNAAGPVMGAPTVTAAINQSGQKVSGSVDKGAQQIGSDTKAAGQTIGKSVDTFGQTVSKLSGGWLDWANETFLRLAFIVVGLVLFAAALWYFARPQVEAAAGVVADVIPAGRVAKAAVGLAKRKTRRG